MTKQKRKMICCILYGLAMFMILTGCQTLEDATHITEYRFTIENTLQGETPKSYPGLMGIPQGNNCPVVFILHGAHELSGEEFTPYYKGFEYLVRELADNGYLAISIDINNAYTGDSKEGGEYDRIKRAFQENYEKLTQANHGKKVFPYDLKGKADLSKINMIGHSRGGDNITAIIADPDFKQILFTSALKITAAANGSLNENYADIPTALIYSQYDEDVFGLDSANYYYYAYNGDLARRTPILSAYLYGANHAAYNTLVNSKGIINYSEEINHLDAETQRTFTKKFAVDFLNVNNKDEKLFDVFNNETSSAYGVDFMLSIHEPYGGRILTPDPYKKGITAKNVNLEYVVSSSDEIRNTAKAFNPPGNPENLSLYKISWDHEGGNLEIPVDGIFFGLTEDKILSLYMALDSSDTRNTPANPVTFDIILTDAQGKSVVIPFSSDSNAALKYQQGSLNIYNETYSRWKSFTPLGSELIKLSQFGDNLLTDSMVSMRLVPTSKTGAIMLGGLDVYQVMANK